MADLLDRMAPGYKGEPLDVQRFLSSHEVASTLQNIFYAGGPELESTARQQAIDFLELDGESLPQYDSIVSSVGALAYTSHDAHMFLMSYGIGVNNRLQTEFYLELT